MLDIEFVDSIILIDYCNRVLFISTEWQSYIQPQNFFAFSVSSLDVTSFFFPPSMDADLFWARRWTMLRSPLSALFLVTLAGAGDGILRAV